MTREARIKEREDVVLYCRSSRTDFGEVLKVEMYLKEVRKPKKGPVNSSSKSNPTVEAKMCLWKVFEQNLKQYR